MSCKDCMHYEVCIRRQNSISLDPMKCGYKCPEFKNKADFAEVRRGEWKQHFAFDCWHYDCSLCDDGYATIERDTTPPNYCQNCGAKMEG